MKCALYFGSFNPVHFGHINIARYLCDNCDIDQVRFIVSPHNPIKDESTLASASDRLQLLKERLEQQDISTNKVVVSDIEFHLPKPLYTINTLREIRKQEPQNEHILIMGADNISIIKRWYLWEELLREFEIWVYPREGSQEAQDICEELNSLERVRGVHYLSSAPLHLISSTEIREGKKGLKVKLKP